MPAIRPSPVDTSFEEPAMAGTSFSDFSSNLAYDALYHSPVSSVYRWSEASLEKQQEEGVKNLLTPKDATKLYGLDGELNFTEPVTESFASLLHDRKIAELRREYELQSGSQNSWGRRISGFGVSMVASYADPVNLASAFIPVVGEERYLSGISRAKSLFGRGLISPKTLASVVGTSRLGYRLGKGAVEGFTGAALVEPFNLFPSLQEQAHYDYKDSLMNLVMGAGMGAGLHAGAGWIGDKFSQLRTSLRNVDEGTHEAAIMSAVNDILQDKHVETPSDIISVDRNVIEHSLQQVNTENMFKIAQEHVDRLSQLPNRTPQQDTRLKLISAILRNPTDASPENLASLFELKLNDEVSKMPDAFNFISEKRQSPIPFSQKKFDEFHEKFFNQEQVDSGHQVISNGVESRAELEDAVKKLHEAGYDLLSSKVEYWPGAETLAFVTKDKVIKISNYEGFGEHISGINNHVEFEYQNSDFHIWVEPTITPLSKLNIGDSLYNSLYHAFEMVANMNGLESVDLHESNIGVDSNGNFRIIDQGTIRNHGEKPSILPPSMLVNQLPKGVDKKQVLALVNQLLKQIDTQKKIEANTTESKVKEIIQRRSQKSPEKVLDNPTTLDKAQGVEVIKSEPESLKSLTPEEQKTVISDLEAEIQDLEDKYFFGKNDFNEVDKLKELLDVADEELAKVKKTKKALETGIGCIANKVV